MLHVTFVPMNFATGVFYIKSWLLKYGPYSIHLYFWIVSLTHFPHFQGKMYSSKFEKNNTFCIPTYISYKNISLRSVWKEKIYKKSGQTFQLFWKNLSRRWMVLILLIVSVRAFFIVWGQFGRFSASVRDISISIVVAEKCWKQSSQKLEETEWGRLFIQRAKQLMWTKRIDPK